MPGQVTRVSTTPTFFHPSPFATHRNVAPPRPPSDLRPLLVPLPATLYLLLLPLLSETPYHGATFAYSGPSPPSVPESVSKYICTVPAMAAFVILNIPPLVYMWMSPLAEKVGGGGRLVNAPTASLALFDLFFALFLLTPVIDAPEMHDVVVGAFMACYLVHLLLLAPHARGAFEWSWYAVTLLSLAALTVASVFKARGNEVGRAVYLAECASYASAFSLAPILNAFRRRRQ